jgi:uncharacterized membrane protein YoaK (UPF0700 family)
MAEPIALPSGAAGTHEDRDGPLPAMLLGLTFVTGLVDAVSYFELNHVFVANMTGNVVFLGFAVAGARDFSIPASLTALLGFLVGALGGGCLGTRTGKHRGRLLTTTLLGQVVLVGAALLVAIVEGASLGYLLILLLALAMGLQNATARRLAVPDLTTTVLTLTLTGLAADSRPAGGTNPRPGRRVVATLTMFLGAAAGAFGVLRIGMVTVLGVTLALLVVIVAVAYRASRSSDAWTTGS